MRTTRKHNSHPAQEGHFLAHPAAPLAPRSLARRPCKTFPPPTQTPLKRDILPRKMKVEDGIRPSVLVHM